MTWTTQRSQALTNLKASLVVGKQQRRHKMEIYGKCHRGRKILFQEFDHRIAYSNFQIASFIKDRISSRRRPIDGWKYMIEVLGPNAKKGRGSVSRIPSISDLSTQPFKGDRKPISHKGGGSSAPDSAELSLLCSWPLYVCLVIKLHAVMFS